MKYLIYLAGPYNAPTEEGIAQNIEVARRVAREINANGGAWFAITPHLNTAGMHDLEVPVKFWYDGDFALLARCDAILMLPGWENSRGAVAERAFAEARGIPVSIYPEIPALPKTVQAYPQQCQAFIDIVMRMYRVHIAKNADYGDNLGLTKDMGIAVRLADKAMRLLSLYGWSWRVVDQKFAEEALPANESMDDSFLDAAVYSVLALIVRAGKWRV